MASWNMADHADDNFDGDIFIYRGGRAPQHVINVLIDTSIAEIEDNAFKNCQNLLTVETHDGIRRFGKQAFYNCRSLPRINIKSVVEIDTAAFYGCENLESVEFGDRLETIGENAFIRCSLPHLRLPSIITIGHFAFMNCIRLTDIELPERVESMGTGAFYGCERIQRIAIPLKRDLFVFRYGNQIYDHFHRSGQLSIVDVVGIHKTVASLHMDIWRTEMFGEINRINQVLPNTRDVLKSGRIQQWMTPVIDKMDHYKAEHYRYVKEGITLLELALWKAKLGEKEEYEAETKPKKAKVDIESERKERRITCGADTVIKNVLPFLQLE